jgi:predicted Zn-ribbon and HTH transcriptional regulator
MPGKFCRGCGKSKEDLMVSDPNQCPTDGPLLVLKRRFCEHCGYKLATVGQDPCPKCAKKAYKFFGR